MTRKTEQCYVHLFKYIDKNICQLRPTTFMTDFEKAMRNGLSAVWPDAAQYTCWFHYCQAVKKRASQLPEFLMTARADPSTIKAYYEIMCLPLLPAEVMEDAFREIKLEALARHGLLYQKFMNYIENQWILRVFIFIHSFVLIDIGVGVSFIYLIWYNLKLVGRATKYLIKWTPHSHYIVIRGLQQRFKQTYSTKWQFLVFHSNAIKGRIRKILHIANVN